MYFMPASCASCTHSSALNLTGLNCAASFSYSLTGICERFMIHSPRPSERLPFPLAGGDRVEAPVDEQPVLRLAEPLEPLLSRRIGAGGAGCAERLRARVSAEQRSMAHS